MTPLFGHEEVFSHWTSQLRSGRIAHGWLMAGPKGIGKATLAHHMACAALCGTDEFSSENPVVRRIAAGSHPDFLSITPLIDPKKGEAAATITAEQARAISAFFSLTPAEGDWRVVIVDSVDMLGANAANALLKILEEPPPNSLLLLISHNPGGLLPTIRSRCALLRLSPLSRTDMERALRRHELDLPSDAMNALWLLCDGAPGLALEWKEEGALALYDSLLDVLATLPGIDPLAVYNFSESLTSPAIHKRFKLFAQLFLLSISRICKISAGISFSFISEKEEDVLSKLAVLQPMSDWAAKWQQFQEQFLLASERHLDYKQLCVISFHSIMTKEAFGLRMAA